jgi:putative FmdB family regulatory protein
VPIYEYKCPNGHVFELFHGFHDSGPDVCVTCGEGPVVRVLHPVAVHFKGSGFYSTDYGRGNKKQSRDGEKSEKGEKGDSGESKKEPEKKAPAAEAS